MAKQVNDEGGHWDYLWIYGPAVILGAIALVLTYQFVDPAPPDRITIATGDPGGAYFAYAQRYRDILARDGIELDIRETAGSVENIRLLESPDSGVDVAFVQGGTSRFATGDTLRSLASLYFEPLWVFHRTAVPLESVVDLEERRIWIGPEGSGTRAVALLLFEERHAGELEKVTVFDSDLSDAVQALLAGELDALFMIASESSRHVQRLLTTDGVEVANMRRAEAYVRRHRFLSKITLPEGVINLKSDLPPHDVTMLAAAATLTVREELHPALIDLLLQAADEVHGGGGLFESPGEFPSPQYLEFPLSKDARRFFKSGPPFLRRTLPFWAATLLDRLKVMLVPLIALVIPLFRIMPPIYRWRMRSRVYRWYKQLRHLEREIQDGSTSDEGGHFHDQIEAIEQEVRKVRIPWSYADDLYQLRVHIQYVRDQLSASPTQAPPAAPASAADLG